jgi:hypothetical protein
LYVVSKTFGVCVALALMVAALALLRSNDATGSDPIATGAAQKPIRFDKSDLFIEVQATDGDAGLHMSVSGEDWARLTLRDPGGKRVFDVKGKNRLRAFGLSGMTFETSEQAFKEVPFRKFKARFPEGRYRFTGTTIEGRRLIGFDRLTHDVPSGPNVLAPARDAVVDPKGLVVRWQPVTKPSGIKIIGYTVIVTLEPSDSRVMSMELGPRATSASIPADFLEPGAEFKVELSVREKNGNRAITEVPFKTSG